MNINTIKGLYSAQCQEWKRENEFYFGITPLVEWIDSERIAEHLKLCVDRFWNNGTCEFKRLLENGRCRDLDKLVPGSWELVFDHRNSLICLYGQFKMVKQDAGNEKEEVRRAPVAYFPYPNDLCWIIGESEYVLRVTASVNYGLISRKGNVCSYQRTWTYDVSSKKFSIRLENFDPYENLTEMNRHFLETCYGQEVTKENFEEALASIPEVKGNSILNFKFDHMSEIFRIITMSNRFANPLMHVPVPINVIKILTTQRAVNEGVDNGSFNNLVLSSNKLFALENARTIIYKSQFNTSFNFTDCDKFFDAFKTSTNKSAGRSRLLLDHVTVKDHMLWNVDTDGVTRSMFDFALHPEFVVGSNVSVLSASRFSENNDAKRIMMTAKLRAQAIPTLGETDEFTHEVPARIVFGDFKGFNFGDSIIVSKSFAKKLQSRYTKKLRISASGYALLNGKYKIGDEISLNDFAEITGTNMYNNLRHVVLQDLNTDYVTVTAIAPFSIGDKITNLHGSKGIVSLIFDDKDMPYLKEDLSENMKAGPFDVVVSALSVYRRKSLGQLFEAWALASGHTDVLNISKAVEKYYDEMQDYGNRSVIYWHGSETIKPCGINMMIRLDHNATGKQSFSTIRTNYARMLKIGEMELLNLASRGLYDIINEIDIRSISKHHNAIGQIKRMQKTGEIERETANNMRFFNILKTIGYDFNLRNGENLHFDDLYFFNSILSDQTINL